MANVFVSYNRKTKDITEALVGDIEGLGHQVWFDQGLSGGQAWWDKILEQVRLCDVYVFVLDPTSLDSTACKSEYGYAAQLGKPILPVLVSAGVSVNLLPPALSQIQFVDYQNPDRQSALKLGRAFATVPAPKPLPEQLPTPPKAPISYLGGLTEQIESHITLSFEQQSALVVDLRRSLRDPDTRNDTVSLLKRLKKRHDLYAAIGEEIDDLIKSAVPPEPFPHEPITPAEDPRPPALVLRIRPNHRVLAALVGAAFGVALAGLMRFADLIGPDWPGITVILVVAGAISGGITGANRISIVAALAGAVLGVALWRLLQHPPGMRASHLSFERAVMLGSSIGAILGAVAGECVRRLSLRSV